MIRSCVGRCAVLLLAVVVCLLSACTSSTKKDGKSSGPATPSKTKTKTSTAPIVQPPSVPASPPNKKGVISGGLVSITSCKSTAKGWQATGTAKGATGKKAAYTITIFFTTSQATVQAFGATKVKVAAGKTKTWTVAKTFKAAPSTRCVIRGAG